jgi:hypothetical protein
MSIPIVQVKKASPRKPATPPRAAAAFNKIAPELGELSPSALVPINIDVPRAVALVLGVLPGLTALRAAIVKQLPEHRIALLDKLENYALAAWYAHLLALPESGPGNAVKPLLDEAVALRATLMGDAEALARRGLLDPDAVADIRSGQGHVDTANDLVALSALFAESWPEIGSRTAATEEEVRRAGDLGPKLLAALGVREHGATPGPTDATDRRRRAFTLFVRAYDQARRAVTYLRWDEGDTELIAPSLYKKTTRSARPGSASEESAPEEAPADTTPAPAPEPATPG